LDDPDRVDQVIHPIHGASRGHYEVDRSWAVAFALELATERRAVRLQAHVHPHAAFHSEVDDQYAIVSTPGFLSLVVPDCAQGPVSLSDAYLARLRPDGTWESVAPEEWIEVES
jgi:hypothetical protein